ncbi:hypothetical protein TNCT_603011 [Trichonephila clavata]|uniref:Uncharacterized protein n=1 Tax=Trichonephila clavata TaxID=2740835 RepID=A0A8X6FZ67_TRICU|nr:hypothetical protein TNCT_603011 [Trichonephila clavata]
MHLHGFQQTKNCVQLSVVSLLTCLPWKASVILVRKASSLTNVITWFAAKRANPCLSSCFPWKKPKRTSQFSKLSPISAMSKSSSKFLGKNMDRLSASDVRDFFIQANFAREHPGV